VSSKLGLVVYAFHVGACVCVCWFYEFICLVYLFICLLGFLGMLFIMFFISNSSLLNIQLLEVMPSGAVHFCQVMKIVSSANVPRSRSTCWELRGVSKNTL